MNLNQLSTIDGLDKPRLTLGRVIPKLKALPKTGLAAVPGKPYLFEDRTTGRLSYLPLKKMKAPKPESAPRLEKLGNASAATQVEASSDQTELFAAIRAGQYQRVGEATSRLKNPIHELPALSGWYKFVVEEKGANVRFFNAFDKTWSDLFGSKSILATSTEHCGVEFHFAPEKMTPASEMCGKGMYFEWKD